MSDAITRSAALSCQGTLPRLVLLSAPAGSGKTTLAIQLAAAARTASVTLRMEPRLAQPAALLPALATAFRSALPGMDVPALAAEDLHFAEAWLLRLIDAATRDGRSVALLLDDMHQLELGAPSEALLAGALRFGPPGFHLLLTSRTAPDPVWARFSAEGQAWRIGFDTLILDSREAAALIAAGSPEQATRWDAAALIDACGGWILAARMLLRADPATSMGRRGPRLTAGDEAIVELIEGEILSPLSDPEGRWLAGLLPVAGLPAEVIDELADNATSGRALRALVDRLLYLEIDGDGRLQMHDLLKAAIRRRYSAFLDLETTRQVQERAARNLIKGGNAGRGLALLSAAHAWDSLATAVDREAPAMAEHGDYGILLSILDPVPAEIRERDIAIAYWHGVSLLNLDPVRARSLLWAAFDRAMARATERGSTAWRYAPALWAGCVDSVWLEWVDCTLFDPLLASLPAVRVMADDDDRMSLLVRAAFAALSFRDPAHADFADWERRNLDAFFRPAPRHEAIRRGIQLLFRYCWGEGAHAKAEQVRARLAYLFGEENAPLADVCTHLVVTTEFLSLFEPRGDAVFEALEKGLAATARHGQGFWDVTLINAALYRAMSQEDIARGRRYTEMLAQRLRPGSNPSHVAIHTHFLAWLHWLAGDNEIAAELAASAFGLAQRSGFAIFPLYYGLALAAIDAGAGRSHEALRQMRGVRRMARAQGSHILTFMACARGALLALQSGSETRARPHLRAALAAAAPQGLMVHPWIRRSEMARLLDLAIRWEIEPAYARALIASLGLYGSSRVRLVTLGRFDVRDGVESRLGSRKAKRITIRIALHLVAAGNAGLGVDELADRVWPEAPAHGARNRLKTALYRLRQVLGDSTAVRVSDGRIALNPEAVDVDAWELESLSGTSLPEPETAYNRALELHGGSFIAGCIDADPDLLIHARHLDRIFAAIVTRYAEACALRGDWENVSNAVRESFRRCGHDQHLRQLAIRAAEALKRPSDLDLLDELSEPSAA